MIAAIAWIAVAFVDPCACYLSANEPDSEADYYLEGDLAGSLRTDRLAVYDSDPDHIWNRLFAALYVRTSDLPSHTGGPAVRRLEGGDWIDFLAWPGSDYWSTPETCDRIEGLLDEFFADDAARIDDPVKRAILLRDLWAAYDFLVGRNIAWRGDQADRERRDQVCRKLAQAIGSLALSPDEIERLPATYSLAVASGKFAAEHGFDSRLDYLPPRLLTAPDEWIEIDFFQPNLHEDLADRFITLHTRSYRARSYFRIFYKYPGGREPLSALLKSLEAEGIDWRQAAQEGFIRLRDESPQIPRGLEVALVQFMMTLDDRLQPTPTEIVESVRLRTYRGVDGDDDEGATNTGVGMNVYEFTLKRRLLFDGLSQGGLAREPEERPQFRILFQGEDAPDWGEEGRTMPLREQCVNCHTGGGFGVHSLVSIVNMGGFDAGAQLGVAVPIEAGRPSPRGPRAARWKTRDEAYRRLVEYIESQPTER